MLSTEDGSSQPVLCGHFGDWKWRLFSESPVDRLREPRSGGTKVAVDLGPRIAVTQPHRVTLVTLDTHDHHQRRIGHRSRDGIRARTDILVG